MNKSLVSAAVVLAVVAMIGGLGQNGNADEKSAIVPRSLPTSLNDLYPPKAKGPVYLMAMHELAAPLSGLVSDFQEEDIDNAIQGFERFREQYGKVSALVPEWAKDYPLEPVDALGAALRTGDPAQFTAALGNVGQVCHSCHLWSMPATQFKYCWNDFSDVTANDPVSGQSVPFAVFMQMIESDLTGIGIDLGQQQPENARAHLQGLKARFQGLKEACVVCHETERRYYVDSDITAMLEKLQAALNSVTVDPQAVGRIIQGIGMESCYKCHLVHIPAAYAKYRPNRH